MRSRGQHQRPADRRPDDAGAADGAQPFGWPTSPDQPRMRRQPRPSDAPPPPPPAARAVPPPPPGAAQRHAALAERAEHLPVRHRTAFVTLCAERCLDAVLATLPLRVSDQATTALGLAWACVEAQPSAETALQAFEERVGSALSQGGTPLQSAALSTVQPILLVALGEPRVDQVLAATRRAVTTALAGRMMRRTAGEAPDVPVHDVENEYIYQERLMDAIEYAAATGEELHRQTLLERVEQPPSDFLSGGDG